MLLVTTFVEIPVVAGRSRTQAGRPHAVSGRPMLIHTCHAHAALCRGLEKSLSERHGCDMARARHGRGMACVNQTRPHCVNQMGQTQSTPLVERHGRGTAWERHGMCESALNRSVFLPASQRCAVRIAALVTDCWLVFFSAVSL
jgi:hypothetical protein